MELLGMGFLGIIVGWLLTRNASGAVERIATSLAWLEKSTRVSEEWRAHLGDTPDGIAQRLTALERAATGHDGKHEQAGPIEVDEDLDALALDLAEWVKSKMDGPWDATYRSECDQKYRESADWIRRLPDEHGRFQWREGACDASLKFLRRERRCEAMAAETIVSFVRRAQAQALGIDPEHGLPGRDGLDALEQGELEVWDHRTEKKTTDILDVLAAGGANSILAKLREKAQRLQEWRESPGVRRSFRHRYIARVFR